MNTLTIKSAFPSFSDKLKYAFICDELKGASGLFSASHRANLSEIRIVLFDIILLELV